jgi:hypothetical protein
MEVPKSPAACGGDLYYGEVRLAIGVQITNSDECWAIASGEVDGRQERAIAIP